MAIKLRRPEAGEERLAWCKNIPISVPGENGLVQGTIDVQYAMPEGREEFNRELRAIQIREDAEDRDAAVDESNAAAEALLRKVVHQVRGFRDEKGEEWPNEDQVDIVCKSSAVGGQVIAAFVRFNVGKLPRKLSLTD